MMRMMKLFVLGALSLVYMQSIEAATLGQACDVNSVCTGDHVVCSATNNMCVCDNGYQQNITGKACFVGLDGQCLNITSDKCSDPNALCTQESSPGSTNYTCLCTSSYFNNGGRCVKKVHLNIDCTAASACATSNATCTNGKCSCQPGFYDSNGASIGGSCYPKVSLGSTCTLSDACNATNAVCSKQPIGGVKCVCPFDFYDSNGKSPGGNCIPKVALGSLCPRPNACATTYAVCSSSSSVGTCVCGKDYYDSNGNITGGSCSPKVGLDIGCPLPSACISTNAECINGQCTCQSGYYDTNGATYGGSCNIKVALGTACTIGRNDMCLDANAECSSGRCLCKSTYYNNGNTCVQRVGLGMGCPKTYACGTTHAVCSSSGGGTCVCGNGYYDNNGETLGGKCLSKVALGRFCTVSLACVTNNAECINDQCSCPSGYYVSSGSCYPKIGLGGSCKSEIPAVCLDDNAKCTRTCTCVSAYYNNGNTCVLKVGLGSVCPNRNACGTTNAVCSNSRGEGTCVCADGYFDSNGNTAEGKCLPKVGLNVGCSLSSACASASAECTNGQCSCPNRYYDSNGASPGGTCNLKVALGNACTTGITDVCLDANAKCLNRRCTCTTTYYNSGSNCMQKVSLGTSCPRKDACGTTNAICSNSNGGGICICHDNYYDSNGNTQGGNCLRKAALDGGCSLPSACASTNAICINGQCSCQSGYYDSNGATYGGSCNKKVALGVACTAGIKDICLDANAECTRICTCKTSYYRSGSTCVPSVGLGSACSQANACGTTYAVCSNPKGGGICVCRDGFYDSNGNTQEGNCLPKAGLDNGCTMPSACAASNAECTNGQCSCQSGYYDSNGVTFGGSCSPKVALGVTCTTGINDICADSNAECTSKRCICKSSHYNNGGICVQKVGLGLACLKQDACGTTNAVCSNPSGGTCVCLGGFYDSNGNNLEGTCIPKVGLGRFCTVSSACVTNNAECINDTCSCSSGYYDSNGGTSGGSCFSKVAVGHSCTTGTPEVCIDPNAKCTGRCLCKSTHYTYGGTCVTKVGLGSTCLHPNMCNSTNAICSKSSGGGTCICRDGFYDSNGSAMEGNCLPKIALDGSCSLPTSCAVNNSECTNGQCSCISGFYDTNGEVAGGACYRKVALGLSCSAETRQVCLDSNAECSRTCICKPTYYNDEGTCVQKVGLGTICPRPNACGTANAFCSNSLGGGTCICRDGFYDSNGNTLEGNCLHKVGLGYGCSLPSSCITPNSVCLDSVCLCSTDYYDITGTYSGGRCQSRLTLNSKCDLSAISDYNQRDQCRDENADCSYNSLSTCTCNQKYHAEGISCIADNPLGGSCSPGCSDTYAECIENKCTCGSNYYDSNGLVDGGNCMPKVQLGSACSIPAVCATLNSVCVDGTCQCDFSHFDDTGIYFGGKCRKRLTLDGLCDPSALAYSQRNQCQDRNATCSYNPQSTCACNQGFHAENSTCVADKLLGGDCNFGTDCLDRNAECIKNKCTCGSSYYDSNSFAYGGTCLPKISLGETCSQSAACYTINAVCNISNIEGTCVCDNGFYDDNGNKAGGKCLKKADLGYECPQLDACRVRNSNCSQGRCVCKNGFFDSNGPMTNGGNCVEKEELGSRCSQPTACATPNSDCVGTVCQCRSGYYDDTGSKLGGHCQKRLYLNSQCNITAINTYNQRDQCLDENAGCSFNSTFICACNIRYHPEGAACIAESAQGAERLKKDTDLGQIAGGVIASIAVVALIGAIVGYVIYKYRKQGSHSMSKLSESQDSFKAESRLAISSKRSIKLSEFPAYVAAMHRDQNLNFSLTFQDLQAISPQHSKSVGCEPKNKMKNRYLDILPFNHTRVRLGGEKSKDDYINASYLPGYWSPRDYIGCQGPLPSTIDDFWRMVWEQNVLVVVMLTLCKEEQEILTEPYWPSVTNEPKHFGDLVVEVTSYSSFTNYDHRVIKMVRNGRPRILEHFHFLAWHSMQTNVVLLDFIRQVRSQILPPDATRPMVVHCNNGVGRTGIYIILDHLMQFIDDHGFGATIDIFDMVMKLRDNRAYMVQTELQYELIHDCVKTMLDRKLTDNTYEAIVPFEGGYQNQEENEYEMLPLN